MESTEYVRITPQIGRMMLVHRISVVSSPRVTLLPLVRQPVRPEIMEVIVQRS